MSLSHNNGSYFQALKTIREKSIPAKSQSNGEPALYFQFESS